MNGFYVLYSLGEEMARHTGPKNRIARRYGVNIFGRARNPLLHKPSPAGQHGAKRKKKSDYGMQLEEQQKLKAVYGMLSQKQLVRYYKEAIRQSAASSKQRQTLHEEHPEAHLNEKRTTASIFMQLLECRLDIVVYRLKFAPTIFAAQQLVSHGHILVNGKRVDRRSFQVKPNMAITVKAKSHEMASKVLEAHPHAARETPEFLTTDAAQKFTGHLQVAPHLEQIYRCLPLEIDASKVCQFLAYTT
jgi:small subunit ribosomal protein S4